MTEPSAKIIADSISAEGHRLTTMEVVMHRFILAEFNTHRVFSRNSASSRAIPHQKQAVKVRDDTAVPISFPAEQKGMQGGDEVAEASYARLLWEEAANNAIHAAHRLHAIGVHKSVTNRIIEPFMWHTVIVSATDWDGFWQQRCSSLAQPEMRVAAEAMLKAYVNSTPIEVPYGKWHKPYIHDEDLIACEASGEDPRYVSAARCARVSYLTHDGKRDVQEDAAMFSRLVSADPPHASPLEHVATPFMADRYYPDSLGNFTGWRQLRHERLGF